MEIKEFFVLIDKLGHYAHRYQDDESIIKTTRHFCDAKHIYTKEPYIYDGFKAIKVTAKLEDCDMKVTDN